MRFKDRLKESQLNDLHHLVNERRTNSTHLKVDVDALRNLLYDYGDLMAQYQQETALNRGIELKTRGGEG